MWMCRPEILLLIVAPFATQAAGQEPEAGRPALAVRGEVREPLALSLADLAGMKRTTVRATDHGGALAEYQGVLLGEVLERAGVPRGADLRGEAHRLFALVEAADGYAVIFALPELDHAFTDDDVLLCDRKDGKPLEAPEGPLRLVVTGDRRHARWIRMVERVTIHRAPASAPGR